MATDLMICKKNCAHYYLSSSQTGIYHCCSLPVIGYDIQIGYSENNKAWVWGTPNECPYLLEHTMSDEGIIKESEDGEEPTEREYKGV